MESANPHNPNYSDSANRDSVFILNMDEANRYFSSDQDMQGFATPHTVSSDAYVHELHGGSWWWLRSPGSEGRMATIVDRSGGVYNYGDFVMDRRVAVRPVLWLNL